MENERRKSQSLSNPTHVTDVSVEPFEWDSPLLGPYPALRVVKQVERPARRRRPPGFYLGPVPDPAAARLQVFQMSWNLGVRPSTDQVGSPRE